jgi:hypothetical protein
MHRVIMAASMPQRLFDVEIGARLGRGLLEGRPMRIRFVLLATAMAGCGSSGASRPGTDSDQMQPSLAWLVDSAGSPWLVAGYTDDSEPSRSRMGLSIRASGGNWRTYPNLLGDAFQPSGDGWLATAQGGSRAYYVSLLAVTPGNATTDESGEGLALATIDADGPTAHAPNRIDQGMWPGWDEPTIAATRPPGADADTIIVSGTPIGPDYQDVISVLVSRDGGLSFHYTTTLLAPGSPGRVYGKRDNTLVRPFLQQDPRAGRECHAYLAFGVYYSTALRDTAGVAPPQCMSEPDGCRSIAESETQDCGETWASPTFIAVDTGPPGGLDFRGFGYAVANDGTRFVVFSDEDSANAPILLKRAAPDMPFTVIQNLAGTSTWDDGAVENVATGPTAAGAPASRWRPTLAASSTAMVAWVEEALDTHSATVQFSVSHVGNQVDWTPPRPVGGATFGTVCDAQLPDDDYMALVPRTAFATSTNEFAVGWTQFSPCNSTTAHHIDVAAVP